MRLAEERRPAQRNAFYFVPGGTTCSAEWLLSYSFGLLSLAIILQ
jgi:hypothetical protein